MTVRAIQTAALAAVAARLAYPVLAKWPPGGEKLWTRTNHRGEPVTLLEGPAVTAAAVAAAALAPGLTGSQRGALVLAGAAAGSVGCYDDLAGGAERHGFRGHLGALASGEVTTGVVKICGIGAAGIVVSMLVTDRAAGRAVALADAVINTGLVAGGANLVNLFDLRPGRAIKVALIASMALGAGAGQARAAAAAPAGAALAVLPEDLGERAMLGDAGANALGAMLGAAAAMALPRSGRLAALAVVAGLTAASETVSFTKVIERAPALHWLDMLGRRGPARR